ncbi:MAG: peptidoglycan-binding protein [Coriobacteriales bacterium]|jgi:peptidoglycan hydrolase-like protein with peptidoglycan-binding domain|nr:peptidoglycan-binding protein [Coriobacteriales bacterium]
MDLWTVQAALATLGFNCQVSGNMDADTASALRDFQRNMSLKMTGQPDRETIDNLDNFRHTWENKIYQHIPVK